MVSESLKIKVISHTKADDTNSATSPQTHLEITHTKGGWWPLLSLHRSVSDIKTCPDKDAAPSLALISSLSMQTA